MTPSTLIHMIKWHLIVLFVIFVCCIIHMQIRPNDATEIVFIYMLFAGVYTALIYTTIDYYVMSLAEDIDTFLASPTILGCRINPEKVISRRLSIYLNPRNIYVIAKCHTVGVYKVLAIPREKFPKAWQEQAPTSPHIPKGVITEDNGERELVVQETKIRSLYQNH